MKTYDIIIVGGGPAGCALSIYLARDGYSVLLMERETFPRDKVCGDFVSPKGLCYLMELDCWEPIVALGCTPITRSSVYLNGRWLTQGSLPHLADHPTFGLTIPRSKLDEILFRQAQRDGAHTVEGCRVVDFQTGPRGVTVGAEINGRYNHFAARVIVGADGANSTVARKVGLEMTDRRFVFPSLRAYCSGFTLDHTVVYFDRDFFPGFGWIFPVNGSLCNIGVGMVKEPLTKHELCLRDFFGRLKTFVADLAHDQGSTVAISRPAGWPVKTYGGARRNYFDRGLLVGEAACFVDPISGEGIPLALTSARIAASHLRQVFERGKFDLEAFSDYERLWRAHWDPDLKVSDLIVSLIRNRHLVDLWLLSLKINSMTALQDREYAMKAFGILSGLVSAREGLTPEVLFKSLIHDPTFWVEALSLDKNNLVYDLLAKSLNLLAWEGRVATAIWQDRHWFGDWVQEVLSKQHEVLRLLTTAAADPRGEIT
jgi:geranylgeranyl reductase family protein